MSESESTLQVYIVKEPRDAKTDVTYQFIVEAASVTATAPDDYTLEPQNEHILVSINSSVQQYGFIVRINDDALIEGTETFQLELSAAEQSQVLLGSITRVNVTIIDDDSEDEGKEGREGGREGQKSKRGWREGGKREGE